MDSSPSRNAIPLASAAAPRADVSIVATCFNHARFLPEFFRSVLGSTMMPRELIVVDDASTDDSSALIAAWAAEHPVIRPVFLKENLGVANAANAGIAIASGKYVLRVDTDDWIDSRRVESQYRFMESHPDIDVLGGNCVYFSDATGAPLLRSAFPTTHTEIASLLRRGENGVLNGTTMIRSSWLQTHRYRQEMAWAEDYDLFARLLHDGARFAADAAPLTHVRIHGASATSNLLYDTLLKAHRISAELFGNDIPRWKVRLNYLHLRCFRRALLSRGIARAAHLGLAALCRPEKLWKRLRLAGPSSLSRS